MKTLMTLLLATLLPLFLVSAYGGGDKTGARVYRSKCKSCHGATGEGINAKLAVKKKLDPEKLNLAPIAEKSDEEVMAILVDGKDKMAGFGEKLKEDQLKAVLAYCRTLVSEIKKEGE